MPGSAVGVGRKQHLSAAELLERGLRPGLVTRQAEAERLRRLPEATMQEFHDAAHCRVNCSLIMAARCTARAYTGMYGTRVLDRLLETFTAYRATGRQVHDANIVATTLDYDVQRLLTFNVADFQHFAPLITTGSLP